MKKALTSFRRTAGFTLIEILVVIVILGILAALIVLFCLAGAYGVNNNPIDVLVMVAFGVVGYLMTKFGYDAAPLVLGFVLGKLAETYLFISMARYGYAWLTQPLVIVLIVLTVLVILFPYLQERRARAA